MSATTVEDTPKGIEDPPETERTGRTATVGTERRISLPLSTVVVGVVLVVMTALSITFGTLYFSVRAEISDRNARAADDRRAEQIAMDYAVGASTIDYRDTKSWADRLKANTTASLAEKFDATFPQLEQVLLPLQWISKATPIKASVMSESGGVYQVTAFLEVNSTSVQSPQGGATTVSYSVTIDARDGWKVTDVGGGIDGALAGK